MATSTKAILATNNAYDTILLANGTALTVTASVLTDFLSDGLDIDNWHGTESWSEHRDDIASAAVAYGEAIATVEADDTGFLGTQINVIDAGKFEERLDFYGVEWSVRR